VRLGKWCPVFVLLIEESKKTGPKPTCPPKKPIEDIDVGEIEPPVARLARGREIRDGLRKLDKSLELLAYALKLKGVTVDAPCAPKQHEVNLEPLRFPKIEIIQLTNPPETTKAYVAPTPKPIATLYEWLHVHTSKPGTYQDRDAEIHQKREDLIAISQRLLQAQAAKSSLELEITAASVFGQPGEIEVLKTRSKEVEKLTDSIDAVYKRTKADLDKLEAEKKKK
jgi:hypothetical protein